MPDLLRRVANDDSIFYVKTNLDAPQYKLITIDVEDDNRPAKDLIAEEKDATLVSINCVNTNNFAIVYKRNVRFFTLLPLPRGPYIAYVSLGYGRTLRLLKKR